MTSIHDVRTFEEVLEAYGRACSEECSEIRDVEKAKQDVLDWVDEMKSDLLGELTEDRS